MSWAPDPVFISYSRADGREFAEAFGRRLEAEGLHAWRDLKSMGAGDIRPQVLHAIERARHLVLILSRRALASDWIKREWSHARIDGQAGEPGGPVLADPAITRADLPGRMKREEVFDIDPARDRGAERWSLRAWMPMCAASGRRLHSPFPRSPRTRANSPGRCSAGSGRASLRSSRPPVPIPTSTPAHAGPP